MPYKTRRHRRRQRRSRRHTIHRKRGGALGSIPQGAIVSIQQDPYSARILVDSETAENVFESRDAYKL